MNELLDYQGLNQYNQEIKKYIEENKTKLIDFSLRIDSDGYLIADYPEGNEQPDFDINSEGFLVFTY